MDKNIIPNFIDNSLTFTEDNTEYNLYKAALEWDLVEPIIIQDGADLLSDKWKNYLEPYHHQVKNLITFCRRLPVTLLADDVGLGKTISAGLIISELIARKRVNRILVVCPKILIEQWSEELETKFKIKSFKSIGKKLCNLKFADEANVVITTYQSARTYFKEISESKYDMLILDEAHKLRNLFGIKESPKVAKVFHQALSEKVFKFVLMLTATPIQNRLWDLYSLIELLTVARGHQNPFGSPERFYNDFIGDSYSEARKLKKGKEEDFRSIIYAYMSRVRRHDAGLEFPERKVQLYAVEPTVEEKKIIQAISEPIQLLNPLSQISILQALTSSPQALLKQLESMASKGTAPESMLNDVREITNNIKVTSKLNGLKILINKLRDGNNKWRLVIFTGRIETQISIKIFLEDLGISCGIINGNTSASNHETIFKFKQETPTINVIISTESGSEGINLQVANILVNYDLPWNPMIVEQRIGRIQRLSSEHKYVSIFNIILKDTFEEYIVGGFWKNFKWHLMQ